MFTDSQGVCVVAEEASMQVDRLFQASRLKYRKVFNIACQVSSIQHGTSTDRTGVRASSIFTLQC